MQTRLTLCALALASSAAAGADVVSDVDIGPEIYQETYSETVDGRRFMQETAAMAGITGTATLRFSPVHAMRVSGRYAFGKSDYTGAYQGGSYGSVTANGQDRSVGEVRAVYLGTLALFGHTLGPSAGLGYRQLTDRLDQAGSGGYRRESEYLYATLGLETRFAWGRDWNVTPSLSALLLLRGTQHSHIDGNDVQNRQDTGKGVEIALAFAHALDAKHSLQLTPFYRYWHIGQSDTACYWSSGQYYCGSEPDNRTREFGLRLSFAF